MNGWKRKMTVLAWTAACLAVGAVGAEIARLGWRGVRSRPATAWRELLTRVGPRSPHFVLTDENSERMRGEDDPANERWMDLAANAYSTDFVRSFSYSSGRARSPVVRVRYDRSGPTLRGRLEAEGLKPNFAYQMKLRGEWALDPEGFLALGYAGRWRLPGEFTNFSDYDFEQYEPKGDVEAYIVFDFVVTDGNGRAAKDFALASTIHVLFIAPEQGWGSPWDSDPVRVAVSAYSPEIYARPKYETTQHFLWAQSETGLGRAGIGRVRLPPRRYVARLALTEESFHSYGDGGFWATVMDMPVSFEVVPGGSDGGDPEPADAAAAFPRGLPREAEPAAEFGTEPELQSEEM